MARGAGDFDTEDTIFNGGTAAPGGDTPPGVTQQPQDPVPADDVPLPRDHSADELVSDAIRNLVRPQGQQPQAPQPQPQPPQAQQPQPQPREDQQPLTPREAAFLRDLREERQRRQELERRVNGGQPQPGETGQQQRDLATALFEDPEAVIGQIQQSFAQQLAQVRLETDLNMAAVRHGDAFPEAFDAFMQQVGTGQDAQTYFRVMNAQSPGEEIMRWYRQNSVLREVGEDPQAYRERLRQEILAEMQGRQPAAAEPAPRQPNGQFAPRHEVRPPTPVGRMNGGTSAANDGALDGSDDAIFEAARPRRR